MISAWWQRWKQNDLPFYLVQIAPYGYNNLEQAAQLRQAQAQVTRKLKNTAMAVTLDLGNMDNISFTRKKDNVDSYSLLLSGMHLYQNIGGEGEAIHFDSITGKAISICAFNMPIIRLYSLAFSPDLFGFDRGNHQLFFNNGILDETGNHLEGPQNRNRIDKMYTDLCRRI